MRVADNGVGESKTRCITCGDVLTLIQCEPMPDPDWRWHVVHDHDPERNPDGAWTAILFRHSKGQRFPAQEKDRRQEFDRQKKTLREETSARRRGVADDTGTKIIDYETFLKDLRERGREAVLDAQRRAAERKA